MSLVIYRNGWYRLASCGTFPFPFAILCLRLVRSQAARQREKLHRIAYRQRGTRWRGLTGKEDATDAGSQNAMSYKPYIDILFTLPTARARRQEGTRAERSVTDRDYSHVMKTSSAWQVARAPASACKHSRLEHPYGPSPQRSSSFFLPTPPTRLAPRIASQYPQPPAHHRLAHAFDHQSPPHKPGSAPPPSPCRTPQS